MLFGHVCTVLYMGACGRNELSLAIGNDLVSRNFKKQVCLSRRNNGGRLTRIKIELDFICIFLF